VFAAPAFLFPKEPYTMNLERLTSVLDTAAIATKHVAVVGAGASADFIKNLARCGVEQFTLFDNQLVEHLNIARQGYLVSHVGRPKVAALAIQVRQINPVARVVGVVADFTALTEGEIAMHIGDADLLVFATDHFPAQARGNQVALRFETPALWIGLSAGAGAGEVFMWHPGLKPCFRCAMVHRFRAFERAQAEGRSFTASSDGADIFSLSLVDAIAGQLALGLLTRGSPNRFGRLVDQLGDRQYIHVQIAPSWTLGGRPVIRDTLGVPTDNEAFFAWCAAARRDPDGGQPPCPDCQLYRQLKEPATAEADAECSPVEA
jgi:hypothetical protein